MFNAEKRAPIVMLLLAAALSAPVLADPPAHAPAHGWRKKHDPHYVGYSGNQWEHDYGILSGSCNRQAVATVIGGVAGAVIASRIADGEHRTIATLIGAAAGAFVGNRIGRRLDDADRGCFGHALEVGKSGQPVTWTNETTGVNYELTPGADRPRHGTACREFTLSAAAGADRSSQRGIACQSDGGLWEIVE